MSKHTLLVMTMQGTAAALPATGAARCRAVRCRRCSAPISLLQVQGMFYGVDPLFRAQLISAFLVGLLLRAAVSCLCAQLSDTCNPPLSNLPPRRHRHRQRRLDDPQQARAPCAARRPLPSYPPPPPAARHEQVCAACCTPRCPAARYCACSRHVVHQTTNTFNYCTCAS